jgi:hypothetical protein
MALIIYTFQIRIQIATNSTIFEILRVTKCASLYQIKSFNSFNWFKCLYSNMLSDTANSTAGIFGKLRSFMDHAKEF